MFVAILDYQNLDNPLFLKSFAEAFAKIPKSNAIILHGDSEYTNRIIQTGVMRDEAVIRSIKDLNHRIVTFLADYGIACIGMNGFQRDMVVIEENELNISPLLMDIIPRNTSLVLSNLIKDSTGKLRAYPLPLLAKKISEFENISDVFVFATSASGQLFTGTDKSEAQTLNFSDFSKNKCFSELPEEFKSTPIRLHFSKPLYNNNLKSFVSTHFVTENDSKST